MRRLILGALIIAIATPTLSVVAGASGVKQPPETGGEVKPSPQGPTLVANVYVGDGPYVGKGQPCTWTLVPPILGAGLDKTELEKTIGGIRHLKYIRNCGRAVEVWVPQVRGQVLGNPARKRVEELVEPPVLVTAPPDGTTYVKLGTWFRTASLWEPVSAHAVVETQAWGQVSATVTATPVGLIFDPDTDDDLDEGAKPLECAGPGEVWRKEFGDERATPCMYTYLHSSRLASNKEFFHTRLSIRWEVTFEDSLGNTGRYADLFTSQDSTMTVKEIQAIIVG